jgi:DeoR family transcriptional regulator of aga operon
MESRTAMVVLPGGVLRRSSESMVGPIGDLLSGRGRIRRGFFGLVGLSTELGLLDVSVDEAHTKGLLADACEEIYGLFDSSKANRFALHSFVATDRITALYSDDEIDESVVTQWKGVGVEIRRGTV